MRVKRDHISLWQTLFLVGLISFAILINSCMIAEPSSNLSAQRQPMGLESRHNNDEPSLPTSTHNQVVRMVIISDTHGHHRQLTEKLPQGDILVHLGDFCNKGSTSDSSGFAKWVTKLAAGPKTNAQIWHPQYEEIFVLEGNHDRTLRSGKNPIDLPRLFARVANDTNGKVQFLQDQMVRSRQFPQLKLYGASWNSCAGDYFPTQFDLMGHPEGPDIMLAHINPYLSPKITYPQLESIRRTKAWLGAKGLSKTVIQNRIPVCMFGHVHWGRGVMHVPHKNRDSESVFINAATLKGRKDGGVLNEPVVVDYDLKERKATTIHCPVL